MTVKELEEKRDDAARAHDDIDKCGQHSKNLMGILGDMKKAKDDVAREKLYVDATTELGYIMQAMQRAKGQLWEYRSLLDNVMRGTEITWPPKCSVGKGKA